MSRKNLRNEFLRSHGLAEATITALVPDASQRRYFRIQSDDHSLMLMDAPPSLEHPGGFIKVTHYLEQLSARVPKIIASDADQGLVLLEDLGDQTMTQLLDNGADEQELYGLAVDALMDMQQAYLINNSNIQLPPYNFQALMDESELFAHWYLPARLGRSLNKEAIQEYRYIWRQLYNALPVLESVLVHRDFHVDNLLVVDNQCAMLDYQDALLGSPAYDLVSLLEDARRDVDPTLQQALKQSWYQHYSGSPSDFDAHMQFWGAQRHCKVAGIFVRLWIRDKKPIYLQHLTRVLSLLANSVGHSFMHPVGEWIEQTLGTISHGELVHFSTTENS